MQLTPIQQFRGRLLHLLRTRFDGQYTRLARSAGVPVTTMQHYMHSAKHLPGGEHAVRLARTLGVTTDYLLAGVDSIRPHELLASPILLVQSRGRESIELDRHVAIPVFACGCPKSCPLSEDIPPVSKTRDRVVVPEDLVTNRHRLIAVRLTPSLSDPRWKVGARLIINCDDREADWKATFLVHEKGRCRLARLHLLDKKLLLVGSAGVTDFPPRPVVEDAKVIGRVVAVVHAA